MLTADLPRELLAGVSGGADSVALLRMLLDAGITVTAVHVNHGLRGEASDGDEAFVRELCRRLRVPLMTYRAVPPENPGEDWARQVRYGFFRRAAEETGIRAVALAHHRDDQAETLLMHLLRGSGLTGLTGMAADAVNADGLRILRPLLTCSRQELREYLKEKNQPWREDASNADPRYLRNALRGDVLPRLEALIPGASARLARTADVLREEDACLSALAEQFLAAHPDADAGCLPLAPLRNESRAMQRRILRAFWQRKCSGMAERTLSARQTEELLALVNAGAGTRCSLPGDTGGYVGWTHLHLLGFETTTATTAITETPLELSDRVMLLPADGQRGDGRRTQALPRAMLTGLTVRTRRTGDWLRPFGSEGRQSLQDYFVNRRVDAPFRDRVPLLCRGSEVLLAGGVGAGDVPRLENTQDAALLCWREKFPWCGEGNEVR
ncbi:MAG: tRNA lysidine(34) synthetase TilS [Clostridia bacterium]|nr:tRNA lysidine(34) synthetase TilS [Clostridia bacterium]